MLTNELEQRDDMSPAILAFCYVFMLLLAFVIWIIVMLSAVVLVGAYLTAELVKNIFLAIANVGIGAEKAAHGDLLKYFGKLSLEAGKLLHTEKPAVEEPERDFNPSPYQG